MALIVLDTSVLIGFLDADDDLHDRSRRALQAPEVVDEEWIVPTTVCAELLVGARRSGTTATAIVDAFLDEGVDRIETTTLPIARRAASIRAEHTGLSLADAFVLATGELLEADRILTADAAWRRVSDRVRVV